ncbi:MAG: hypothetical protein QNJ31_08415 [Candidatus Caenarcaniphilales bacterium]|nr:hypothetical protein [Candidatus Caenarcaniphilales bacterium]
MSEQADLGIEKIPQEYRTYCWDKTLKTADVHWETFRSLITQIRFGGVSSESEAKRLFYAEQIGNNSFFTQNELPSNIANKLTEEIEYGFQNLSRPVTTSHDQETQIIEILNYYFPSETKLRNFELALNGDLDVSLQVIEDKQSYLSTQDKPDFEFEDQADSTKKEVLQSEKKNINNFEDVNQENIESDKNSKLPDEKPIFDINSERPLVKAYVESQGEKKLDLPAKIKRIIEGFYPN